MAVHTNATAGAALGNELRAGTVAQVGSTKRIQALNGMLHANRPNVDITRARAYTKIYKQTEGMPSLMRRYKASAEVYRTLSDNVYDHEQLVGWPTQKIRGANFAIELHAHWLAEDLPNLRERTYDPFDITDEDYRELEEELLPYWKDKTMAVQWGHYVSQREWNRGQFGGVSDVSNYLCANGSHFIPAWTDVIQHGFIKYYEKAQRLLEALDPNDPESIDKRIFYTGILEVLEAIRDWGERLSAACARRAREEKDPVRKQELENMAAMMKRVPWGPATSFHDACETAWAVCFFLFVEGAGPSITWGRFDQYMYPYYGDGASLLLQLRGALLHAGAPGWRAGGVLPLYPKRHPEVRLSHRLCGARCGRAPIWPHGFGDHQCGRGGPDGGDQWGDAGGIGQHVCRETADL